MHRIAVNSSAALRQALEQAEESAEIVLRPGLYELVEPLDIHVSISIAGAGADQTVVSSNGEGWLMRFLAGMAVLRGVHFSHTGEAPANVVIAVCPFDIRDCRFTGGIKGDSPVVGAGLTVIGEAVGRVVSCEFTRNEIGLLVLQGSPAVLQANRCFANHGAGLSVHHSSPALRRNRCAENGGYGIFLHASHSVVTGNEASRNGEAGIGVYETGAPQLEDNLCEGNQKFGIAFLEASAGRASTNNCRFNHASGILVDESAHPDLYANRAEKNQEYGIRIAGRASVTARLNQCDDNALSGLSVTGGARAVLEGNLCRGNQACGLGVQEASVVSVKEMICQDNRHSGVWFDGEGESECANVISDNNGSAGFMASERRRVLFVGCKARMNQDSGFHLGEGAPHVVDDCVAEDNREFGIFASTPSHLRRNTCKGNGRSGIYAGEDASYTIEENTLTENHQHGLAFSGTAKGTARANACTKNVINGIIHWGQSAPQVVANLCLENQGSGIMVTESAQPILQDNLCRMNRLPGIVYSGNAGGVARNNTCSQNLSPGMAIVDTAHPLVEKNLVQDNVKSGIWVEPGARPRLADNVESGNNRPDPDRWIVTGCRNGRPFDYKQFALAAAVPIEPAALLERAARTLRSFGWSPSMPVMQEDSQTGGVLATFRISGQGPDLNLSALSLVDGQSIQLNLTFTDTDTVMWLKQQQEHLVLQTLYALSLELRDLTQQPNPWVCLYGDWRSDIAFRDPAGRTYEAWSGQRH